MERTNGDRYRGFGRNSRFVEFTQIAVVITDENAVLGLLKGFVVWYGKNRFWTLDISPCKILKIVFVFAVVETYPFNIILRRQRK